MLTDRIGRAAGQVWHCLDNEGGSASLAKIRDKTKLDTETIYLGQGWLEREEKVEIEKRGRSLRVTLVGVPVA